MDKSQGHCRIPGPYLACFPPDCRHILTPLDFFSGIALNLERSFAVGDRVQIESSDLTGDIVEINWRTTVIQNFTGNYLIISETATRNLPAEQQAVEVRSFATQLMDKMRGFFRAFRRPAMNQAPSGVESVDSSIETSGVSRDS